MLRIGLLNAGDLTMNGRIHAYTHMRSRLEHRRALVLIDTPLYRHVYLFRKSMSFLFDIVQQYTYIRIYEQQHTTQEAGHNEQLAREIQRRSKIYSRPTKRIEYAYRVQYPSSRTQREIRAELYQRHSFES